MTTLIVIAKEPVPGRAKTRLCPPCTLDEAAGLAEAALRDTFTAVAAAPAPRRVVVLDGRPGPWLPGGFEVIAQRAGGLAERLAGAFDDVGAPAFLVGMDTPQLTSELIEAGVAALESPGVDAVLGPAPDGGYWAVGLRRADPRVFLGVPMSTDGTLGAQRERLDELGLSRAELPPLRDVDTIADAHEVARADPNTHFARALAALASVGQPAR